MGVDVQLGAEVLSIWGSSVSTSFSSKFRLCFPLRTHPSTCVGLGVVRGSNCGSMSGDQHTNYSLRRRTQFRFLYFWYGHRRIRRHAHCGIRPGIHCFGGSLHLNRSGLYRQRSMSVLRPGDLFAPKRCSNRARTSSVLTLAMSYKNKCLWHQTATRIF